MNHMNRTYGKTIPLLCSISLVILLGLSGISEAQSPSATTAGQDTNSLLVKAPFDRIILSDKTDLLIEPVSPRPLPPAQKKPAPRQPNRNRSREAEARAKEMENDPAIRILVQPLEAEGMEYAVYREDITEILYFDDMLLAEADRLTNQGEFAKAFEHLLYVNSRNPEWSGLSDSYRKLLLAESKERFEAGELASGLQFVMEALTRDSRDEQARSLAIDGLAKLAEEELSRNQLERARESHARMKKLNPNAEEVKRLEDKLKSISEKLFADAPSDRPERLDQLNEAYRAWPDTTGLSEARVAAMNRWPTVRVAVSETAINPPRPWAVGPTGKRLANLLFLPLLQDLQESSFKGESPLQILEKFEMTDLTTASLTVRSGQKWSNGREINARDVVAAMSAWAQPTSSAFHGVWSSLVDSVSVPSPNKVQIRFTRPIFQPEAWLLRPIGPAENSQAEELPESAWLGSGLMLWQGSKPESSGDQAVFIRRPDLDKGLYRLQEIVISDEDEAWQAMIDQRVDLIEHVPASVHASKPPKASIIIADYGSPEIHVLALDGRKPELQNRSLRRALAYALNRSVILEEQFLRRPPGDDEILADGAFEKGSVWDDKTVKPISHDMALATLLFASAKRELKTDRIRLTLEFPSRPDIARTCSRIADDLKSFGIDLDLRNFSADELEERLASGRNFEIAYRVITQPSNHFAIGGVISPSIYARPVTNGLAALSSPLTLSNILDVERAWDENRVRSSALFIDRLCREELPIIPLWQIPRRFAYDSRLSGIRAKPLLIYETIQDWQLEVSN